MKVFKYIVRFVLSLMVVFYLLPASLFQIPYFQKKISLIVTEYIENRIETKVEIEKIEFQPFNKLILKNVYLEDQNGDAVLSAKRIAAGFDFRSLFQNKFNFGSVQLYSFQLNLSKEDEKSPLNIQYIIDAFKKKNNDDKDTPIDVRINNLSLAYGTFSYKVKNKEASPNVFNPNDIYIRDISVKIKLKELTNNLLDVDIKKLTCKEKSGLQITQLYGKVFINTDEAKIDQLYLELPHSKIKLSDLSADFRNVLPEDNFMEKTTFNFRIEPSNITLYDISALAPVFSKFHDPIKIEGKASGTLDDIVFNELKIQESKNIFLSLDGNVRNLSSPDIFNIFIKTNINDSYINEKGFQQLADNFNSQPVEIPKPIRNLGQVVINGNVSGFLSNLTSSVFLHSKIGNLRTDINFGKKNHIFLKGKVHSTEINLKDLIGNPDFGPAVFGINIDATYSDATGMKGNVDALINRFYYKSYTYENISLQGDFTSESFKGNFNADSPHGQLTAEGLFVFKGKDSEFNFSAKASELLLDELNLTQKYTDPELSFSVDADFKGNNIDNLEGSIVVNNLLFSTNKGGYQIKQIDINTLKEEEKNHWTIHSDILNGEITGNFTWKNIVLSLKKWSSLYLPSLFENNSLASPDDTEETHFAMNFTVNDTREFSYIFELPLTVFNQAHITGNYNNVDNQIHLTANIPYMQFGNYRLEDSKISIENNEKEVQLHISGLNKQKENHNLSIAADIKALNDTIYSCIRWKENKNGRYKGDLDFNSHFSLENNRLTNIFIEFEPSKLVFNDSLWIVSPTVIEYKDKRLNIDNFEASHNQQKIKMDGYISEDPDDEIKINLNKVNLDYIFKSLNIKALTFGGIASGFVSAKDVYKTRQLSTELNVDHFSFNSTPLGDLQLDGVWIDEEQGIQMKGFIFDNDNSFVNVDGFIYPVKEELSILFDAKNTNAAFLRKYLNNIVREFSGNLTGKLRLFGDLNNPTVEGNIFVESGRFGVEFLNTYYTFTDWVRCTPDKISINNTLLYDQYGNKALANGHVTHKLFDDFKFDANLTYENFMIFDATQKTNPVFYGPVFGTGTASIKGTEDLVHIDVSLYNTEKTHLTLNLMDEVDIVDYDFINFIQKEKNDAGKSDPWHFESKKSADSNSGFETDIRLNLNINANNQANVDIIMDPASGDKITGTGSGNIQILYGTYIPMKVIGSYRIERGRYNFSFQQALFRRFEIEEGSSITFRGNPYTADLNIKAAYTVSANLGDLDQQLLLISARNNIPVNCVLLLTGPLEQPVIDFDIQLPSSTPELERQVKSYIRTDDMMNRQIVYLLVLGRFYTSPEYARDNSGFNNDLSYLTSTISNQISNMLGSLSDKFQVGTKFHQSYEGEEANTEIELLLSSTLLNNRLIINGNFGYIDNIYTQSQDNNNLSLVGDFDIEYKLTPGGEIRLKGFNRYNYRNYFSTSPEMTQGFGILFRKDFNNLKDLFGKRRRIRLINLPEENETPVAPDSESNP